MQAPDIYMRTKVSEDMYDTLVKFAEIRKLNRANFVTNFDLYPEYTTLVIFERKYGDSINYYDQHGVHKKKKKRRNQVGTADNQIEGSRLDGSIG